MMPARAHPRARPSGSLPRLKASDARRLQAHDGKAQGRLGLGVTSGSNPMKVAGARWKGKKARGGGALCVRRNGRAEGPGDASVGVTLA